MELEQLKFCARYPFSDEAKAYLDWLKLDLSKVEDSMLEAAIANIKNSIQRKPADIRNSLNEINDSKEPFLVNSIILYPLSKILLSLSNDILLKREFAKAEAQRTYYFLQFDETENIEKIAKQLFNVEKKAESYTISFERYLKYLPDGPDYKLINTDLENGILYLDKHALSKLVEQYIFQSIMKTKANKKDFPKIFSFFTSELKKLRAVDYKEIDFGDVEIKYFPPCIKKIYFDLKSGEKVSHYPRFVLATFLASIGMKKQQALEIFRTQPNFNEKKTLYYLEHAYGDKTGTKYSPPACLKMESYTLCYKDNSCRWKHPLSYYQNKKGIKRKRVKK